MEYHLIGIKYDNTNPDTPTRATWYATFATPHAAANAEHTANQALKDPADTWFGKEDQFVVGCISPLNQEV